LQHFSIAKLLVFGNLSNVAACGNRLSTAKKQEQTRVSDVQAFARQACKLVRHDSHLLSVMDTWQQMWQSVQVP
jgi:hypothetical protein